MSTRKKNKNMNINLNKPITNIFGSAYTRIAFLDKKDLIDKRILDIGCGAGWFELYLEKFKINKVIGIDINHKQLAIARRYSRKLKNAVKFEESSALSLPLSNSSCDTVVCWEVLEHIPKNTEPEFFSEVDRVLKKKGVFYLSTPNRNLASMILDPAWWLIGHRHYSKESLYKYAQMQGFQCDKIWIRGGIISLLYNINMYVSKWILRREPVGKDYLRKLSTKEYKREGYASIFIKMVKK